MAPSPVSASTFELRQLARANELLRQRRLADAALAWEVLTVLRPDVAEYRQRLADTRRQIDAAVADQLPRAGAAARRGELDAAARQYLAVLALQPQNAAAADALRAVERERNRRSFLGRPARLTLLRPGLAAEARMSFDEAGASGNDVEHAALLADQGEVDAAIRLLKRRLVEAPSDIVAQRLFDELMARSGTAAAAPRDAAATVASPQGVRTPRSKPQPAVRATRPPTAVSALQP